MRKARKVKSIWHYGSDALKHLMFGVSRFFAYFASFAVKAFRLTTFYSAVKLPKSRFSDINKCSSLADHSYNTGHNSI